jgi:hypothetical protein
MDDNLEKLAKSVKTFTPQMLEPPYSGIPTFFGAPHQPKIKDMDCSGGRALRPGRDQPQRCPPGPA